MNWPFRIIIVEDELLVSDDLMEILSENGYHVAGAAMTGEEAVRVALENQPDLILMDITLKGNMDGVEAASRIRRFSSVPIVFLSAHVDSKLIERVRFVEPAGYVMKPFSQKALLETVKKALSESPRVKDLLI